MPDELAVYFESRETRMGRLPEDVRSKLSPIADESEMDRQFVSAWMSRRMGVPRDSVLSSFDQLTAQVFGEGTTPSAAYDRIVSIYHPPKETEATQGGDAEAMAEVRGLPQMEENGWQAARSMGSGFQRTSLSIPQGFYSQLAAVTDVRAIAAPERNPEWVKLNWERQALIAEVERENIYLAGLGEDQRTMADLRKRFVVGGYTERVQAIDTRLNELNQTSAQAAIDVTRRMQETPLGEASKEYRRLATFWETLAKETPERWGVNPAYRETTMGIVTDSIGGAPVYAAMAALGPPGVVGMESALFSSQEEGRKAKEGEAYDPQAALPGNVAAVIPQLIIERAFGVERILNKALGETAKVGGRVRWGDFVRNFFRRAAVAGAEEGVTEPVQGMWQDYVNGMTYDESASMIDADYAKRRLIESLAGFATGVLLGGSISVASDVDANASAQEQGTRVLTAHDQLPLSPDEFKAVRPHMTDRQLMAFSGDETLGQVLIGAVNGDAQAQVEYNKAVKAAKFVDTKGGEYDGISFGEVGSVPVMRDQDGNTTAIDLADPEQAQFFTQWQNAFVVHQIETEEATQAEEAAKAAVVRQQRAEDFDKARLEEQAMELEEALRDPFKQAESIVFDALATEDDVRVVQMDVEGRENARERAKIKARSKDAAERSDLLARLEQWADGRLIQGLGEFRSASPQDFAPHIVKGAFIIARGARTVAQWTVAMGKAVANQSAKAIRSLYAMARQFAINHLGLKSQGPNVPPVGPTMPQPTGGAMGVGQTNMQAQAQRIRAKALAQRGQLIQRISAGQALPQKVARAHRSGRLLAGFEYVATPIVSRLEKWAPKLAARLRKMELNLHQAKARDFALIGPFLRGAKAMSKTDLAQLDLALMNGDAPMVDALVQQYGLQAEYAQAVGVIDNLRTRIEATGLQVGKIANYWPRHILDRNGLLQFYQAPVRGVVDQALADATKKAGRLLSADEENDVVASVLKGHLPQVVKRPANTKARTTDVVSVDASQYYADFAESALRYIDRMNESIASREFFTGHNNANQLPDASAAEMVREMVVNGTMEREGEGEVVDALRARFTYQHSGAWTTRLRALGHVSALGQIGTTIQQLGDWVYAAYEAGLSLDAVAGTAETLTSKSKVKRADLGLTDLAEEFRDRRLSAKIVDGVFKATGMHYVVVCGQQSLINTAIRTMSRQARTGRFSSRNRTRLANIFPDVALRAQVVTDLAAGNVTSDTALLAWHVLSDWNPTSLSEYPAGYLNHPTLRVLYSLKTFDMKRFDAYRRESWNLIKSGNKADVVRGVRTFAVLGGMFMLSGMTLDWVRAWIIGRETTLTNEAWNNLWKLFGLNRYALSQGWRKKAGSAEKVATTVENLPEAVAEWFLPPLSWLTIPAKDLATIARKAESGEELRFDDFESVRLLPLYGSGLYYRWGKGEARERKRRSSGSNRRKF